MEVVGEVLLVAVLAMVNRRKKAIEEYLCNQKQSCRIFRHKMKRVSLILKLVQFVELFAKKKLN